MVSCTPSVFKYYLILQNGGLRDVGDYPIILVLHCQIKEWDVSANEAILIDFFAEIYSRTSDRNDTSFNVSDLSSRFFFHVKIIVIDLYASHFCEIDDDLNDFWVDAGGRDVKGDYFINK